MNTVSRLLASGPGALIVTGGLVLAMVKMISVPFVALPEKPEKMSLTDEYGRLIPE